MSYPAAGLNHQAWVLRFEHGGRDLYPVLDEVIHGLVSNLPTGSVVEVPCLVDSLSLRPTATWS